jgi:hypothetical protein
MQQRRPERASSSVTLNQVSKSKTSKAHSPAPANGFVEDDEPDCVALPASARGERIETFRT